MTPSTTTGGPDHSRVTEYFAPLAATYGDGAYYRIRRRTVIKAISDEITRARSVLDLGCGNGAYLVEFAAVCGERRLFGVDLSMEMLTQARRRLPSKCPLARAEASRLPFKSGSFDLVFASHVLPFVSDLEAAVREAARCLRPGGVLIATRQGDGGASRQLAAIISAERLPEIAAAVFRHASRLPLGTLDDSRHCAAFTGAGLELEERPGPFVIEWADIAEWVRIRWMPVIPEAERPEAERMMAEVGKTAAGRTFALDEPIMLGHKRA